MRKIKVMVVDDSEIARKMLKRCLAEADDMEVVGEAGTGPAALLMMDDLEPDVVLLETSITGGMPLNDVVGEICASQPDTKILLCTEQTGQEKAIAASQSGGVASVVAKPYQKTRLLRAIREAVGEGY